MAGASVDDAVQPALAGPGLDQREPGLRVIEFFEVALESGDELGLGDGAVAEMTVHEGRVQVEIGGGEEADRGRALQVAVELEEVAADSTASSCTVVLRSVCFVRTDAPT